MRLSMVLGLEPWPQVSVLMRVWSRGAVWEVQAGMSSEDGEEAVSLGSNAPCGTGCRLFPPQTHSLCSQLRPLTYHTHSFTCIHTHRHSQTSHSHALAHSLSIRHSPGLSHTIHIHSHTLHMLTYTRVYTHNSCILTHSTCSHTLGHTHTIHTQSTCSHTLMYTPNSQTLTHTPHAYIHSCTQLHFKPN